MYGEAFIADDAALIREGLSGILERTGHEVVGHAQDAVQLRSRIGALLNAGEEIDVLVTDVRMPPEMRDDGLRAAADIRRDFPQLGVMVLSQYVAPAYASVLFHDGISSAGEAAVFRVFLDLFRMVRKADWDIC
ncbi:response regulator [Arcanobacterium hippocoleae]|uniref:response regulator n=1 Tax=Arcanobacterium hippocoleae TaxID=149017 RepID=UPI003DA707B5